MKFRKLLIKLLLISTLVTGVLGCYGHPDPYVRQGRRGGAALGAGVGAIIGNNVSGGNSWGGAAIGAAVGGLAGDRRGKVNSMYYNQPRYYYYR